MDRRDLLRTAALVLGATVSNSCSRALLSGAALDTAPADATLDEEQLRKVAAICELIIPQTDTCGAIEAGVPTFVQSIVSEWYTPAERDVFLIGLDIVDVVSRAEFGAAFLALTHQQQVRVLEVLETGSAGVRGIGADSPFFANIKELTVLGYYTSELGSRQELLYRPVPGAYHGSAHFDPSSRQWTQ
jgi:hypothetical protein